MKRYSVTFKVTGESHRFISANSEQEAYEIAQDLLDGFDYGEIEIEKGDITEIEEDPDEECA